MIHRHLPASACQAQAILGAWKSGNRQRICEELDRAQSGAGKPTPEAAETERMELLCAIAAELRVSSRELSPDNADDVCGLLLRHLAASGTGMEQRGSGKLATAMIQ